MESPQIKVKLGTLVHWKQLGRVLTRESQQTRLHAPADAPAPLGKARARYLSSEAAGGFTGVFVGLYATGNGQPSSAPAHFDWFDYEAR